MNSNKLLAIAQKYAQDLVAGASNLVDTVKTVVTDYMNTSTNLVTTDNVNTHINDYLAESGIAKKYISVDKAKITTFKGVNAMTGEYIASGAFYVYAFDITGLYDSGIRGMSTFVQTYAFNDEHNEGYIFRDADGAYISGGVASVVKTIEDVIIDIPENAVTFEISVTRDAVYSCEYREFLGLTLLSETELEHSKEITNLKTASSTASVYSNIVLGNKIYAVVGDTIQLFYKSFVDCDLDNMIVKFGCAKGKNYPRYWEFTPVASDVGEYTITIEIYSKNGNLVNSATTTLVVAEASNPASAVNVLCIGDSTMSAGQIPIEASRRLKGTTGVATSPTALALDNFNFVGRRSNAEDTVGWEGTGGWSYNTYNTSGRTAVRITVTDATDINISDVYLLNGYRLEISEINVTDGAGNIRCLFSYLTPYDSSFDTSATSGTLTYVNGNGQDSITYTAWELESYQPFWNNDTDSFDITTYANTYCDGSIDIVFALLGINNLIDSSPFASVDNIVKSAKLFCDNIHSQYHDCKILLSTLPLVSVNGGISANYGAGGESGMYNATGFNHKVFAYNKALIELEQEEGYSDYVTIVNTHAQFDVDNSYPVKTKAINTRVTTTETVGSNAVHPANHGYWQIADGLFRALLNLN